MSISITIIYKLAKCDKNDFSLSYAIINVESNLLIATN